MAENSHTEEEFVGILQKVLETPNLEESDGELNTFHSRFISDLENLFYKEIPPRTVIGVAVREYLKKNEGIDAVQQQQPPQQQFNMFTVLRKLVEGGADFVRSLMVESKKPLEPWTTLTFMLEFVVSGVQRVESAAGKICSQRDKRKLERLPAEAAKNPNFRKAIRNLHKYCCKKDLDVSQDDLKVSW
jgi:hypothetical protein